MTIDGNPLWRQFKQKVEVLEQRAPDGYVLVGHAYLHGRAEPVHLDSLRRAV